MPAACHWSWAAARPAEIAVSATARKNGSKRPARWRASIMVDPSGGAEVRVVAGLAGVLLGERSKRRGSPLDQYLPSCIGGAAGGTFGKVYEIVKVKSWW